MEYENVLHGNLYSVVVLALLWLLTGCGATDPQAMGAVHAAPAEASSAALSPGGWLGPVTSLQLYPIHVNDDAYVAIYTGYDGESQRPVPVMGVTDGTHVADGWVAHGMYSFVAPEIEGDALLSCVIGPFHAAAAEFITIYGRAAPEVATIEAVRDDAESVSAVRQDDLFVAVVPRREANDFIELNLFDSNGAKITTIQTTECQRD